jgi:hypothetical protein
MIMDKDSPFKAYERNITSQFGEDGVIDEIFHRIGTKNKICVEFGAWDGEHFSNTWNLWHNNNWNAILIEADKRKFNQLKHNIKDHPKVKALNIFVSSEGADCLENILNKLSVPKDFDFLSLDIDGDDFYILESLSNYKPKLILVEYNPTIPPHFSIVQKKSEFFGSSAKMIYELAKTKGYQLVHMSDTNLFLVHQDYFQILKIKDQDLFDIFPSKYLNYIFSTYDGEHFASNKFTYGIKKSTKELFSFREYKVIKECISKKFPFEPDNKTQKLILYNQIKRNI